MKRSSLILAVVAAVCCHSISSLHATDGWPEFRGPRGDGHAEGSRLPTKWSETENVRWKVELPGRGWSTPVIEGDHIWMTSASDDGHEMFALCVDRTSGKLLKRVATFEVKEPKPRNKLNSYASPSSVVDNGRVFINYGTYGVACLDSKTGKIIWSRRDVNLDHMEGPGSSMILYDGRLIYHCDGRDVQYVIALDCESGKTVWRTERSLDLSRVGAHARKAFTTPLIVPTPAGSRLISPGAQGCYAYDPVDGREIWRLSYAGFSNVPRPVAAGGLAYIVDTFERPKIYALRYDGFGDLTKTSVAWTYDQNGPSTPSPILLDEKLLFVSDKGILTGLDAQSGKRVFRERLGGNFSSSPIAAAGLVYFFNREGAGTVVRPVAGEDGPTVEVVASNQLDEGLMASPAVCGNDMFLRTPSFLYCVGN